MRRRDVEDGASQFCLWFERVGGVLGDRVEIGHGLTSCSGLLLGAVKAQAQVVIWVSDSANTKETKTLGKGPIYPPRHWAESVFTLSTTKPDKSPPSTLETVHFTTFIRF
jgi:hypothetical protein